MASIDGFTIPQAILRHFDLSSSPYSPKVSQGIQDRRRKSPERKLFYDGLLELAGLDGSSLYPPTTPAGVRRLLHSITSCSLDRLKQDCLLYYLLKDYDDELPLEGNDQHMEEDDSEEAEGSNTNTISTRQEEFANRRLLPMIWRDYMNGYWSLDNGLYQQAIEYLSNPGITQINFIPTILTTLSTSVSPPSLSLSLIRQFFIATHHDPSTPLEQDLYTLSLAADSIPTAFHSIRTIPDLDIQGRCREAIWSWALGSPRGPCGKPSQGTQGHLIQKKALNEILHLPLTEIEESHLIHFLTNPPKSISQIALSLLHDLVTLRLIHKGAYAETLQLDKELAGFGGKEEDKQKRREMVREFIGILPETQRRVLKIENELEVNRKKDFEGFIRDKEVVVSIELDSDGEEMSLVAPKPIKPTKDILPPAIPKPASPFSGPPVFAPGTPRASPIPRVLSGSPFALPNGINNSQNPTPSRNKRKIIVDDGEEDSAPALPRRVKRVREELAQTPLRQESSAPAPTDAEMMPPPPLPIPSTDETNGNTKTTTPAAPRRSGRSRQPSAKLIEAEQTSSLPITTTTRKTTRARSQSTAPSESITSRTPKRSNATAGDKTRATRSVSRALSHADEDISSNIPTRRNTRRGTSVATTTSDRESPTPSVASSTRSRRTTGRNNNKEGSETPKPARRKK